MTGLKRHGRAAAALFLILISVIALATVQDYTGSYDEYVLWNTIRVNLHEYALLLEKIGINWEHGLALDVERIFEHSDRDHGLAPFYLCAPFLARMDASLNVSSTIWCLITLVWFLAGVCGLYGLAREMGLSRLLSCMAALLLYLSPRLFAEGHYNDRDIVLLSVTNLCLWSGLRFLKKTTLARGVVLSVFGALATNIRLMGILSWGLMGVAAIAMLTLQRSWSWRKAGIAVGTIAAFLAAYTAITPATWVGPSEYFSYQFDNMAVYGWTGWMMFRSALFEIPKNPLPRYYLPYMMLTTLPVYLFPLCAAGFVRAAMQIFRQKKAFFADPFGLFLTAALLVTVLPVAGCMLLQPVIYNGWRHFYLALCGVLVYAAYGLQGIWHACAGKRWMQRICTAVVCLCFALTATGMIANHPHQGSYYNVLAGSHTMETDYWNSSGEAALKKLIRSEERNRDLPLEVGCWFFDIQNARFKLSEEEKALLTTTVEADAPYLYYIENYVQNYNVPDPEGYHVLFEVESYGRLVGTMYERDI